jgi:hypothetical protein
MKLDTLLPRWAWLWLLVLIVLVGAADFTAYTRQKAACDARGGLLVKAAPTGYGCVPRQR